jgi:predicted DNA-binding protein YlxM (UPF0122 family)
MSKLEDILKDYLSINDICREYKLSRHAVEYLIRTRKENGLNEIIVPIGRKFYIQKEDFEKWAISYYGGH